MNNILIWVYRAIPLIVYFSGASILIALDSSYVLAWIHGILSGAIAYPIVKFESKLFSENR